jgi:hypothetical protein
MNAKTLLPLVALAMVGWGRPTMYTLAQDAAPADPGASAPSASPPTVHLLKNNRLVEGRLMEGPDGYVIEQPSASNPGRTARFGFPKDELVASYADMEAYYLHKRSEIAENDPHEHMALARWCLSYHLKDHAREHLEVMNRLLPGSREAQAMLTSLKSQADRQQSAMQPLADPALRTVSTTAGDATAGPGQLPAEVRRLAIQQARETFSGRGAPVILDLPPALAMKRAQEFNRGVHLVLQNKCASCHHERSGSSFQLIQVQRRSDNTPEVVLFNLDAALRLVDPDELSQSQLLVSSLMPHKPNNRPILTGQNDRNYRVLSAWVHSLKSPNMMGDPGAMPQGFAAGGQAAGNERFAGNRPEVAISAAGGGASPVAPALGPAGLGLGAAPPMEFPTEAVVPGTGSGPAIPGSPKAVAPVTAGRGTAGPPIPGMDSLSKAPAPAPAGATPTTPALPAEAPAAKAAAPAKPVKIDNKALDAFLRKSP